MMQMRVRANVVPLPAQSLPTQAGFVLPTFDTLTLVSKLQASSLSPWSFAFLVDTLRW